MQDRRDGGAGRAQEGLTETETGDQKAIEGQLKDEKRKWKKMLKKKRNKRNRARRHHAMKKFQAAKVVGRQRFHIPKNVQKLKEKRCKRRREYRAYMRSRVSELRRKEEIKWLQQHPTNTKKGMHQDKKWNKRAQIRTMRKSKAKKTAWKQERKRQKSTKQKGDLTANPSWQGKEKKKVQKIPMHHCIKISVNNERNMNAIAKRQQLANQWEEERIDLAMMGETNKNTGGMEDGPSWGNEYIVFFSSGVKPKVKDEQERKRLENWEKAQKKRRRKKGKADPQPMAKANKKQDRKEAQAQRRAKLAQEWGKGKGKGKGPSRRDADFEHAGVAIAVRKKWKNNIKEVREVSGRIILVTLAAAGGDLHFVSVYAPPANHSTKKKESFYEALSETVSGLHGMIYIGGDFNARMYERLEHEKEVLGEGILTRKGYITTQEKGKGIGDQTRENRDLFIDFLKTQELTAVNTLFQKPAHKLVTYKEKVPAHNKDSEEYGGENTGPYDHTKYAQCDYLLTKQCSKRTVLDCETRVDLPRDSDHIPLVAEVKTNMRTQRKPHNETSAVKYYKPDSEKFVWYNEAVTELVRTAHTERLEAGNNSRPISLQEWTTILANCAESNLEKINPEIRKDYISRSTWSKIERRNALQKEGDPNKEVTKLNKEIKKDAFQDRKQKKLEEFNENPNDKNKKDLWRAVKNLRSKYTPKYIQMRNREGKLVPLNKRAETIAEYLEKEHWNNPPSEGVPRRPREEKVTPPREQALTEAQRAPFELAELNLALKKAKKGKEPGPDGIRMELLKWLNATNRAELLATLNQWWEEKVAPEELYYARIATIYKKGETDKASNYRPISLLSSFYKIYMMLIRERIQTGIEAFVTKTQYGFRPARSTSHAIFILKRIQEFAESTGTPLYMTLLDWEKAFDKVDHDCLCKALERFSIHQEVIEVLRDGYAKAGFYVRDQFGKSAQKRQRAGIRQGCPLSPYLFVLVMACVDFDIQQNITEQIRTNRIPGTNFDMVYYADDTIIVSRNLEACEKLISMTEEYSSQYGLNLNRDKCVNLNMNTDEKQKFQNGTSIKSEREAMYLGNELNYKADPHLEVTQKLQEVNRTLHRMQDYWKASEASPKWKILIQEAVLKSKLLYGLETTQLTNKCLKRMDAFQIRGLRKILNLKHTHWDRTATNARILQLATEETYRKGTEAQKKRNEHKEVQKFSTTYKQRREKLLGHIIRTGDGDPLRQVTLQEGLARPVNWGKRRNGHPREKWTQSTMKGLWKKHRHLAPKQNARRPNKRRKFKASGRQCKKLKEWAEARIF